MLGLADAVVVVALWELEVKLFSVATVIVIATKVAQLVPAVVQGGKA